MRIELKKGKQKELIYNFKNRNNFSWNQLAKFLGVSKSALLEWKHENNLLPQEIFQKLDVKRKYYCHIIKIKKDNWGKSKGGNNSKYKNIKKIKVPEKSLELAELCGIILGDGNITYISRNKKIGVYTIKIGGDSRNDINYLKYFVKPLIEKLFGIKTREYKQKGVNCHYIIADGIQLIKFFNSIGIKSGNKIRNKQTIPNWILKNSYYLKGCIRGLIDTDGSVFRMSNKDPYLLRIGFDSHIPKLLQDFFNSLKLLGYTPHIIRKRNKIYLSKQCEIKKYIKEIGFSNEKHLNRISNFQRL